MTPRKLLNTDAADISPEDKLAPCGTDIVESLRLTFLPRSKSHDTKTVSNIKNTARSNLRISGQLPAPIVNGGDSV